MKINNYTVFNSTDTENWNKLRDSEKFKGFHVPFNKDEYIKDFKNIVVDRNLIEDLIKIVHKNKVKRVISFCSGTCYLEYFIKKKFKLNVIVSDYTSSIERISNFKIFDDVIKLDINNKIKFDFKESDLILLSRIDTEFTDSQLLSVFKKLMENNARRIYFIPAEILTFKTCLVKIKIIIKCFLNFRKPVKWGYIRSDNHFKKIFNTYFTTSKLSKGYLIYSNEN
jgi:hypothetical protein